MQKRVWDPIKHLERSFLQKHLTVIRKKNKMLTFNKLQMFERMLKTPLLSRISKAVIIGKCLF